MHVRQLHTSISVIILGVLGIAGLLIAWWDSTQHYIEWLTKAFRISLIDSAIHFQLGDYTGYPYARIGFSRGNWHSALPEEGTIFPMLSIRHALELPIWLIGCAFLSSLFLVWIFLMKRITYNLQQQEAEQASSSNGGNALV
jgi:hypothetical protein